MNKTIITNRDGVKTDLRDKVIRNGALCESFGRVVDPAIDLGRLHYQLSPYRQVVQYCAPCLSAALAALGGEDGKAVPAC